MDFGSKSFLAVFLAAVKSQLMIKEAVCVTFYFLLFQPQRPALATSKAIQ